jgi:hypothetical protein
MSVSIASDLEDGECHCFKSFDGTACDKSGMVICSVYVSVDAYNSREEAQKGHSLSIHDVSSHSSPLINHVFLDASEL